MSEFKTHLSKSAADMFRLIMKGMHEGSFYAVSFPMLMYGILNSNEESNPLERYFVDKDFAYEDTLYSLANLINLHFAKLAREDSEDDALSMIKYPIHFNRQPNDSKQDTKRLLSNSKKTSQLNDNLNSYNKADLESIVAFILLKDMDGKTIRLPVDATVYGIFEKVFQYIDKYSIKVLEVYHFIPAMFEVPNKELRVFFDQNKLDFADAKKYFTPERIFKLRIIPIELASFLNVMNDI